MKRFISIIYILFFCVSALSSQELAAHLYIRGLESASAPVYHPGSDSVIFSYQVKEMRFQPRHVGISFEHERFASVHEMQYVDRRDEENRLVSRVYFHFLPLTPEIQNLERLAYRFVVDGAWLEDPLNPAFVEKLSGRRMSVAQLPPERETLPVSPEIRRETDQGRSKLVKFRFFADPGQRVNVAGSFNNWDPFMYVMREATPGEYELTLRLLPGDYHYNYYYRGRRIIDPLNVRSSYDIEGYEYSTFSVDS